MTAIVTSNQLSPAERDFQEKMKERMRAAMGDLMPDEVLRGIVERGINEAFFARPELPKNHWNDTQKFGEAWMVTFVREDLRKQVETHIKTWMADNPDKIVAIMQQTFDTGLVKTVINTLGRLFQPAFDNLQAEKQDGLWTRYVAFRDVVSARSIIGTPSRMTAQ